MPWTITVGTGRQRPKGRRFDCQSLDELMTTIDGLTGVEAWWAPAVFADDHRAAARWQCAWAVGVDIDTRPKRELTNDERRVLEGLMAQGRWPGTFGHLTPHGIRVVFVLEGPTADRALVQRAMAGAAERVARALAVLEMDDGYAVDDSCRTDLARLFFAPNAVVRRDRRSAKCLLIGLEPTHFDRQILAADAPRPRRRGRVLPRRPTPTGTRPLAEAAARWCDDHRSLADDWPLYPGPCPACGHHGCFHQFDDRGAIDDRPKWRCFSSNHGADSRRAWAPRGVSYRAGNAWVGDALDLASFTRRQSPTALLRRAGYLGPVASVLSVLRDLLDDGRLRDGQAIGELRALVGGASAVGLALRKLGVGLRRRRVGGRLVTVVALVGGGGGGGGGGAADCNDDDADDGDAGGHRDGRGGDGVGRCGGRVSRSDST